MRPLGAGRIESILLGVGLGVLLTLVGSRQLSATNGRTTVEPGQSAGKTASQPDGEGAEAKQTHERGRSTAEWVGLGISTAIVLTLVGLISYERLVLGTEAPVVDVQPRLEALRHEAGGYYLPVDILNRGDLTAEDVRVRVSLASGQGQQESAELAIPFLAGGGTASGTVVFRQDPSRGTLSAHVLSYLEP